MFSFDLYAILGNIPEDLKKNQLSSKRFLISTVSWSGNK